MAQAAANGRGQDPGIRGQEAAKAHVDSLLKFLNKLEHARWDYNPNDTRGQGNMGKVNMRDPYGFDKDSGREGSERGRAIREPEAPTLNLAELVAVDWQIMDWYLQQLQAMLDAWRQIYAQNPTSSYAWLINYYESLITMYTSLPYDRVVVNYTWPINYTLNLGTQEGFEGTTLLVTTNLVSLNDYNSSYYVWTYNPTGSPRSTYTIVPVQYDAGEVVMQQTQEVIIGEDSTYTFGYDPPTEIVADALGVFQLAVTVTEPVSGASYTITYDRDLWLYRCPYGIAYDKTTGKPIAGARVTIHNADGSIVALDKGANPNASNPQTTDATGRYNAKLLVGQKYYLAVKAPGYAEYKSALFSELGHIVREDVGLTPLKGNSTPAASAVPSAKAEGKGQEVRPGLGIGSPRISK